jgi:hypothetical protein
MLFLCFLEATGAYHNWAPEAKSAALLCLKRPANFYRNTMTPAIALPSAGLATCIVNEKSVSTPAIGTTATLNLSIKPAAAPGVPFT